MFIANTGEELGLLGADYFAAHPTVPAASIVGAGRSRHAGAALPVHRRHRVRRRPFDRRHGGRRAGRSDGRRGLARPDAAGSDLRPLRPLSLRHARRAGDPADDRLCQWRRGAVEELPRQGLSHARATTSPRRSIGTRRRATASSTIASRARWPTPTSGRCGITATISAIASRPDRAARDAADLDFAGRSDLVERPDFRPHHILDFT